MKKIRDNLMNIVISMVLVFVLVFATFASVAEAKNQPDWDDGEKTNIEEIDNKATEAITSIGNRNSNLGSNNFTLGATNGLWTSSMLANTKTSSSDEELAQIKKALSDAKAANEQLSAELDASQVKQVVEKAEKERLEKLANDLQEQLNAVHPIKEKNGKIWVHVDDFLNLANDVGAIVQSENGYAMRTTSGVRVSLYDDMCDDQHLDENFDLPMVLYADAKGNQCAQVYQIALTSDEGQTAYVANFGIYNYDKGGLFTNYESCEFPQSLTTKPKNGGVGYNFYELIKSCAVVTTADDGSYRFAILSGNFEPNPVIKKPEPEKVIERVETKVEVEKIVYRDREVTKVIEICGRCKKLYNECTCPDVEVVVIEKKYCGRCGELYEECICKEPEPVIIRELVPVYIYVDKDDPNKNNQDNNPPKPDEGKPAGSDQENNPEPPDQAAISDTSGTDTDITEGTKYDTNQDGTSKEDSTNPDSSDDTKEDGNGTDTKEDVKDDTNKDGTTKEDSTTPDSSDDIKYDGNGTDNSDDIKYDISKDGTTPDNSEDIKEDGNENYGKADNGGNVLNDGNQGVNEISDTTAGVYNDISGNTYNDSTEGTFSDTTGNPTNSRCSNEGSYS